MYGYDLLQPRNFFERIDFDQIELKYDFNIPPILKLFYATFKWKKLNLEEHSFYFYPILKYGDIYFYNYSIEEMIISSLNTNDDDIIENKLLNIASGFKSIYVGTLGDQKDKVLLDDSGEFVELAPSIFSFFKGITDNLMDAAESKEEYMRFMSQLGFEGEELHQEGEDWLKINSVA